MFLCRLDPAIGSGRAALGCRKAGSMGERGEPWCRGDPLDGDAGGESSGGAAVIEAGRARVRWDRWSVRIGLDLGVQRRGGAGSGRERRGAWEAQWTTAVRVRAAACASASGFWRVLGLGLPRAISLGQRAVRAALWQAGDRWGRIASEGMQRGSKSRSRAKRRFYGCSRRVAARVRRSWTPWPLGWGPDGAFHKALFLCDGTRAASPTSAAAIELEWASRYAQLAVNWRRCALLHAGCSAQRVVRAAPGSPRANRPGTSTSRRPPDSTSLLTAGAGQNRSGRLKGGRRSNTASHTCPERCGCGPARVFRRRCAWQFASGLPDSICAAGCFWLSQSPRFAPHPGRRASR